MPQNVALVLSEALRRTGAAALPYAQEFRFLVQQHMTELVSDMPSLQIKTRKYTHIDGSTATLLLAEGTVPMFYQGVKYNIPVALWLPEQYPLAAPLAYVEPTLDMVIKPHHRFVDASGLVHTPYISQWQYPTSNLREMAQDMSMHFGSDPPLFSKPKRPPGTSAGTSSGGGYHQQQRPPPPPPPPQYGGSSDGMGVGLGGPAAAAAAAATDDDSFHAHNPLTQGAGGSFTSGASFTSATSASSIGCGRPFAGSGAAGGGGGPTPTPALSAGITSGGMDDVWRAMMAASGPAVEPQPQPQRPQPEAKPPPPPPPPPVDDPTPKLLAAFRGAAAASLNKRLHASLTAVAQQATAQREEQLQLQATLRQRGEQLQSEVAALQAERVALDKLSQDLAASSTQLDRWLAENEHLAQAADDPSQLDPDAVITAADPLSQQALEVQAQDLALEDALYALDKALNSGVVNPDAYLKQVRAVCRRQFFVRTIGNKVAAAQQEQQCNGGPHPGPPAQHTGVAVHGDVQRTLSAGRPVVLPQGDSWANAGIIASGAGGGGSSSSREGLGGWFDVR